jgi:hypothetical protein
MFRFLSTDIKPPSAVQPLGLLVLSAEHTIGIKQVGLLLCWHVSAGGAPGGKLAVDMSELRSAKEQLSRANADYK